ncbi:MAG: DsbA family oxidoreductase [Pseudomonadota bacterium]|nr:DsbA family oxidoreductase [Pseudomonadota bacterium]
MPNSAAPSLVIHVVSDVVCPWCYIGKRHLDSALKSIRQREGASVAVRWQPFELNPDLPPEGIDRRSYVVGKFGAARASSVYERVASVGRASGIGLRFDLIDRQPNTRDAHRAIAWVQGQGLDASPLVERLFSAFFCEGRALVGTDALVDLAAEAGIDAQPLRAHLAAVDGCAEVVAAEARAHEMGVTGVPFMIFNGRVAVSGAQPSAVILQAIEQAQKATTEPA